MKPVIFICGPYRAGSAWKIEQNIRIAERLALDVWEAGYVALCPHTNTRFFHGMLPDEIWLDGAVELLHRCDAVVWTGFKSNGVERELEIATRLGLKIFDSTQLNHPDLLKLKEAPQGLFRQVITERDELKNHVDDLCKALKKLRMDTYGKGGLADKLRTLTEERESLKGKLIDMVAKMAQQEYAQK